MSDPHTFIP